jgi:hypothetical protein
MRVRKAGKVAVAPLTEGFLIPATLKVTLTPPATADPAPERRTVSCCPDTVPLSVSPDKPDTAVMLGVLGRVKPLGKVTSR